MARPRGTDSARVIQVIETISLRGPYVVTVQKKINVEK